MSDAKLQRFPNTFKGNFHLDQAVVCAAKQRLVAANVSLINQGVGPWVYNDGVATIGADIDIGGTCGLIRSQRDAGHIHIGTR